MKKILLFIVMTLVLLASVNIAAASSLFEEIGEGQMNKRANLHDPLRRFGVSFEDFKNMSGMWMTTDPDVQFIISTSYRSEDSKRAIRYEFFYQKKENLYVIRGQYRAGKDRKIFHAIYDPSTRLLIYSTASCFSEDITRKLASVRRPSSPGEAIISMIEVPNRRLNEVKRFLRSMAGNVPFLPDDTNMDKRSDIGKTVSPLDELARRMLHGDKLKKVDNTLPWAYGMYTSYTLNVFRVQDIFYYLVMQSKNKTKGLNCEEEIKRSLQGLDARVKDCMNLSKITNEIVRIIKARKGMTDIGSHPQVHRQLSTWMNDSGTKRIGGLLSGIIKGMPTSVSIKNIEDTQLGLAEKLREPESLNILMRKIKKPVYLLQ